MALVLLCSDFSSVESNPASIQELEVMLSKNFCLDVFFLLVSVSHSPRMIDGHLTAADGVETITDQLYVFDVIHGTNSRSSQIV